jgi:hypothetical protein
MRKILVAILFVSTLLVADGLYTISYLPNSIIEKPFIDTGIKNSISGDRLLDLKIVNEFNLYFENNRLKKCSQKRLNLALKNLKGDEYIALIGHSRAAKNLEADIYLNKWEEFWQGVLNKEPTVDDAVEAVNKRLRYVYSYLKKKGVEKIYVENRVDRDPVSTEATDVGSFLNDRVQVLILR